MTTVILVLVALDAALFIAIFAVLSRIDGRLEKLERRWHGRTSKKIAQSPRRKKE